jgi:hypothetical protein
VWTIEQAVEAAVRTAYEAWLGQEARPTDLRQARSDHPRTETGRCRPTVQSNVVGWDRILGCADAAADIGPQIRAELARVGMDGRTRSPRSRRRHRRQGGPSAAA